MVVLCDLCEQRATQLGSPSMKRVRAVTFAGVFTVLAAFAIWVLFHEPIPTSSNTSPHEDTDASKISVAGVTKADRDSVAGRVTAGADVPFTEQFLDRVVPSAATSARESPRRVRATVRRNELEAHKREFLERVEKESVEDAIANLLREGPSPLFHAPLWTLSSFETQDMEYFLLKDPRVARIMSTAISGDDEARKRILDATLFNLKNYLSERQSGAENRQSSSGLGADAFPILLSEVDERGQSLPLLSEWYDIEWAAAEASTAYMIEIGRAKEDPDRIASITNTMPVIAAAAAKILNRLDPDSGLPAIDEGMPEDIHGPTDIEGLRRELEGYPLLVNLNFAEMSEVMEHVRGYLDSHTR